MRKISEKRAGKLQLAEEIKKNCLMKKILVPVDFSENSKMAFQFARELARRFRVSLDLVHCYLPEIDAASPFLQRDPEALLKAKMDQLKHFQNQPPNEGGGVATQIEANLILRPGYPGEEIVSMSRDYDLIVMGTTGVSNPMRELFGSVSSEVALHADCAVMLVPPGVTFRGFNNILFASHYDSVVPMVLYEIREWAGFFRSNIHFVHVRPKDSTEPFDELEERIFKALFEEKEPEFAFYMTEVAADSVVDGLNAYADKNNIDLVVMVHPRRGFFESIFHKSQTKALALNARRPLLVFHASGRKN
ncbi:MAG: universal stress protein [Bacteroidetes bacterium]|nr:MAG: universal stress protein [Bacteroidota bacterium]